MQRAQVASLARSGKLTTWPTYSALAKQALGRGRQRRSGRAVEALPPVETWDFREVVSRLKRAAGLVAKNIIDVPRLRCNLPENLRGEILDQMAFIMDCSDQLCALIAAARSK